MATEAQVTANRLNAQKSTGPRTPEGKASVAQNAVKHGLYARMDVIGGEDLQEYELWKQKWFVDLQPLGHRETTLAERIVSLSWRLRRAQWVQNEAFDYLLNREFLRPHEDTTPRSLVGRQEPVVDPQFAVGRMVVRDFSWDRSLDRLQMCEQRIEGSLCRMLKQFDQHQALRRQAGEAMGPVSGAMSDSVEQSQMPASAGAEPVADSVEQSQMEEVSSLKCEVSSGTDSVEQSQLPEDGRQGARGERPEGGLRETKPICPAGQALDP